MPSSLQLRKIEKRKIGIRSGTEATRAAYAMSDLGDEFSGNSVGELFERVRFIANPVRGGDWERAWAERYYNTVLLITLMRPRGRLLVVSRANPTAERYPVPDDDDRKGTGRTFRKCNSLPDDSEILDERDYTELDTVRDLLVWITSVIDALPDPGNNFF